MGPGPGSRQIILRAFGRIVNRLTPFYPSSTILSEWSFIHKKFPRRCHGHLNGVTKPIGFFLAFSIEGKNFSMLKAEFSSHFDQSGLVSHVPWWKDDQDYTRPGSFFYFPMGRSIRSPLLPLSLPDSNRYPHVYIFV